jgi:type VI secretion system secreted protein Hcp
MSAKIFAKIGDIKGESFDNKHKGEIEVLSWSWGVSQSAGPTPGGGGGTGRASFSDFHFTHHVDRASPLLLAACATGRHIKDATVSQRNAGEGQQDYLIIKMNDILVTGVQLATSETGDSFENVSLKLAKVDLEYKPQLPNGSLDTGVHFRFDIAQMKEG